MNKLIFVIGCLILLVLALFIFVISSAVIFICAIISGIAAIYFFTIFKLGSWFEERKSQRRYPAPFLVFGMLLPVGIGFLLYLSDMFSIILTILLTGLTLVFFYNFLMIPLAIYNKSQEKKIVAEIPSYPSISVMIPAYNEEGYIGRCIEAVMETDYPSHKKEVIVIDDGSKDETYYEAKRYEKEGVKVVTKENGGKYSALNYGFIFAKGNIIVTIDADSIIARNSLKLIVKRFQSDPEIGAVAGNVKVLNAESFLTKCQALEYLVGINIFRRALDVFGAVSVVPGCLGAFKRRLLEGGGFYDPDTLTEDFDVTIKMRKLGKTVQASSGARVYTEVPSTLNDLYRQRSRWYRGNFQTIFKHRNVITNPRFGLLQQLSFPFLVYSMSLLPLAGIVVLISIILGILGGLFWEILSIFVFFNLLTALITLLAIEIDDEDFRLLAYSPFLMFGYKHFLDFMKIKSLIDVLFGRTDWTSPRRSRQMTK